MFHSTLLILWLEGTMSQREVIEEDGQRSRNIKSAPVLNWTTSLSCTTLIHKEAPLRSFVIRDTGICGATCFHSCTHAAARQVGSRPLHRIHCRPLATCANHMLGFVTVVISSPPAPNFSSVASYTSKLHLKVARLSLLKFFRQDF